MSFDRRKVLKALRERGFEVVREGGRHTIVGRRDGARIAVPRHRELNRLTVRGIAEDAGADWETFKREVS